jgi:hypothetical protein
MLASPFWENPLFFASFSKMEKQAVTDVTACSLFCLIFGRRTKGMSLVSHGVWLSTRGGKFFSVLRKRKVLDFIAALTFLVKRNGEFSSVIKAYKDFKKMKSQYKKTSSQSYPSCVYYKSLVIQSKLKLKQRFSELNQRNNFLK